jgi:hypothetical protein
MERRDDWGTAQNDNQVGEREDENQGRSEPEARGGSRGGFDFSSPLGGKYGDCHVRIERGSQGLDGFPAENDLK